MIDLTQVVNIVQHTNCAGYSESAIYVGDALIISGNLDRKTVVEVMRALGTGPSVLNIDSSQYNKKHKLYAEGYPPNYSELLQVISG